MSHIRNCRSRAQNIRLLEEAIRRKMHRKFRCAEIGIFGFEQTGKKSLALRFSVMDGGPFVEEIVSFYFYTAFIDIDNRPVNGSGDVYLNTFIIPAPPDLPLPELYFVDFLQFSVLIFLTSVISKPTFEDVLEVIYGFYEEGLPYFFIVGNKTDLNRIVYPDHFTSEYGSLTAYDSFGVSYLECSAKQNMDVDPVLDKVLGEIVLLQPE